MKTLLAALLLLLLPPVASAQDRIAVANVELILALMPETKAAEDSLTALQASLANQLETKERYAQQKLQEAQEAVGRGAPEDSLNAYRDELNQLEAEIRRQARDADREDGRSPRRAHEPHRRATGERCWRRWPRRRAMTSS